MQKILFANIGWMKRYHGHNNSDKIKGGGSYNPDDKHEAFNFQDVNGHCYGYVQPTKWSEIQRYTLSLCTSNPATVFICI